jgi:hypothetical protein
MAEFVAGCQFADVPARLIERGKIYVLDNLAAGFVGSTRPWTQMVAGLVSDLGGCRQASCFNCPEQTGVC